jgi:hypothetical protein
MTNITNTAGFKKALIEMATTQIGVDGLLENGKVTLSIRDVKDGMAFGEATEIEITQEYLDKCYQELLEELEEDDTPLDEDETDSWIQDILYEVTQDLECPLMF